MSSRFSIPGPGSRRPPASALPTHSARRCPPNLQLAPPTAPAPRPMANVRPLEASHPDPADRIDPNRPWGPSRRRPLPSHDRITPGTDQGTQLSRRTRTDRTGWFTIRGSAANSAKSPSHALSIAVARISIARIEEVIVITVLHDLRGLHDRAFQSRSLRKTSM